jgi:hypothetical protein
VCVRNLFFEFIYNYICILQQIIVVVHRRHIITHSSDLLHILTRTTRLSMMLMSPTIHPRKQPRTLRIPLPQRRIRPGDPLKAERILGHTIRNTLRIQQIRVFSKVVDIVTCLVIARVERRARLTAKHDGFLLRLEDLGAGEEAAGGDAVFEERGVVGAQGEEGGDVGKAAGFVEFFEILLDLVGARGAGEVEGVAVAIVDAQDVVGGCDHVEVEVGAQLVDFGGVAGERAVEGLHVVEGTEFAEFLSAPETEADGVGEFVFCEGEANDERANGARAVVVDAGAREDGVCVASDH